MSGTFVLCLIVAVAAIAYWRITLVITGAIVLALLVSGVSAVAEGMRDSGPGVSAVAPSGDGATAARPLPPG